MIVRLDSLILLLGFCFISGGSSIAAIRNIHFEQDHFYLGVIERNRQPRFFHFDLPILNASSKDVKLLETRGNCSCFTIEQTPEFIRASKSGIVRVSIDKFSARNNTNYTVATVFDNGDIITTSFSMSLLDRVRVSPDKPLSLMTSTAFVTGKEILVARTFALEKGAVFQVEIPSITFLDKSEDCNVMEFSVTHISSTQIQSSEQKVVTSIYKIRWSRNRQNIRT